MSGSGDRTWRMTLHAALTELARVRREPVEGIALRGLLDSLPETISLTEAVEAVCRQQGYLAPRWSEVPDAARVPFLAVSVEADIEVVVGRNPDATWALRQWSPDTGRFSETSRTAFSTGSRFLRILPGRRHRPGDSPSLRLILGELLGNTRSLLDIAAGTLAINLLALAVSLYSMQVYDRVIPTQAASTLWVLTIGVTVAVLLELFGKWVRSSLLSRLTDAVDQRLARSVFSRFLAVRLDQLPPSVGVTSSRLRGYESVRAFLVGLGTHMMIDAPMALLLLAVLYFIGGPLAFIPFLFLLSGLTAGMMMRRHVARLVRESLPGQQQKTGLLIDAVEGAEILRAGHAGWRMLSRWLDLTDHARQLDVRMRHASEHMQYILTALQHVCYVALVAVGALHVGDGALSVGGLIACTILSGRILGPMALLPQQWVQWGYVKVALQELDTLWQLEAETSEESSPVMLESPRWEFEFDQVQFLHQSRVALDVKTLRIRPGERLAVVGSVGSGKTTLLRLLSGLYKPSAGRVLLDGIDLNHIDRASLTARMGYVPQEGRLFSGTLRDNLLLGLQDPGDEIILAAATRTGLFDSVIAHHPRGLSMEIEEGGYGLSGGQRQCVHFTRALLRQPTLWLLDEPTSSMDAAMEMRVMTVLKEELALRPGSTLVLVTHKPALLPMVERLCVCSRQQLVLDGPRETVLKQLAEVSRMGSVAS